MVITVNQRITLPLSIFILAIIMLNTIPLTTALNYHPVTQNVETEFVIASWVGSITDVRFNMLAPQFWWDLGNELVYEKLAVFVRKNNSFIPWLAESWEWKNDTTLVIHLRHGVTWNDGSPFTSKDVWTQIIIVKAWGWKEYQDIIDVETPDDYTVVLRLRPNTFKLLEEYFILYSFPMALPHHLFGQYAQQILNGWKTGNKTMVDNALAKVYGYKFENPIGTGPYMLQSRTSAEAIFVKYPGYWDPSKQVVDRIRVIRAQDNPHMWSYYQGGTVDSGDAVMPPQVEETVKSKPWAQIIKVPDSGVALYFNTNSTYLSDYRVRQAIAYIIDRQEALSSWSNVYKPVQIPDALADWMRSQWLDQATISSLIKYEKNLDKAKELLEEAGFTYDENTKKWYTPDGKEFVIKLYAPSGWTDWSSIGQAVAKQLQDFGITVDYRAVEDTTLWGQVWPGKQFDIILNWWGPWNLVHPWVCHWQWINRFESINLPTTFDIPGLGKINASEVWRQLESSDENVVKNATRILSILVNKMLPILPLGEKEIPVFVNTRKGTNSPYIFEWPSSDDPLWYSASISRFETTLVLLYLHHAKVIITGGGGTTTSPTTTPQGTTTTTTTTQPSGGGFNILLIAVIIIVVGAAITGFILYKRRTE